MSSLKATPIETALTVFVAIMFAPMITLPNIAFTWPFFGWQFLFAAIVAMIVLIAKWVMRKLSLTVFIYFITKYGL